MEENNFVLKNTMGEGVQEFKEIDEQAIRGLDYLPPAGVEDQAGCMPATSSLSLLKNCLAHM